MFFLLKEVLQLKGPEKLTALKELSERYGCDWIEYNESINQPVPLLLRLDLEKLKKDGWFPRTVKDGKATIIACAPSPELAEEIKKILAVTTVDFLVTLPG